MSPTRHTTPCTPPTHGTTALPRRAPSPRGRPTLRRKSSLRTSSRPTLRTTQVLFCPPTARSEEGMAPGRTTQSLPCRTIALPHTALVHIRGLRPPCLLTSIISLQCPSGRARLLSPRNKTSSLRTPAGSPRGTRLRCPRTHPICACTAALGSLGTRRSSRPLFMMAKSMTTNQKAVCRQRGEETCTALPTSRCNLQVDHPLTTLPDQSLLPAVAITAETCEARLPLSTRPSRHRACLSSVPRANAQSRRARKNQKCTSVRCARSGSPGPVGSQRT